MKRLFRKLLLIVALLPATLPAAAQTTPIKTLVVYDQPSSGSYQKLGLAYAIMLRNLLGHFDTTVDLMPVEQYTAGKLSGYQATFYLGALYDNPVPPAFLADVTNNTTKTVVWFKYNLWQLAWNPAYDFNARFGFAFNGVVGLNAVPSASNPSPGFFDTVHYPKKSLLPAHNNSLMAMVKYYAYDPASNVVSADPEIGVTQILDANKAQALVPISNSKQNNAQVPYVVRSGNLWYFADIPFSFIGPRDRYLVVCDLLHDILGVATPVQHRAMVRLEDVGALVTPSTITQLSDYLSGKQIPFSIAVIPFYRDPLGKYNGGVAQEIPLGSPGAANLRNSLNYAIARGAKLVMHGYTHQYANRANVNTGVSADDFEFWDATNNRPVDEEIATPTPAWARGRLDAGKSMLAGSGYTAFAWEAPHYHSSPNSIKAVVGGSGQAARFTTTYQRVVYYTSDNPTNLNSANGDRDFAVGQFFPYIIRSDYYGQRVLPENLGNIEYDISSVDPTSNFNYTWEDLKLNAEFALVIRNGFGSFFFHPFWLDSGLGVPGYADFQKLVEALTALGYTWTDASGL